MGLLVLMSEKNLIERWEPHAWLEPPQKLTKQTHIDSLNESFTTVCSR